MTHPASTWPEGHEEYTNEKSAIFIKDGLAFVITVMHESYTETVFKSFKFE